MLGYMFNSTRNDYNNNFKLKDNDQPLDTISQIIWDPYKSQSAFLTSSWDGFVRYYMIRQNRQVDKVWDVFLEHPVLSIDLNQDHIVFAGLSSGDIAAIQMQSGKIVPIGKHEGPINRVFWIHQKVCLISLGFDNSIKFWDVNNSNNFFQGQFKLPLKTYTSSFDYPYLLIGSIDSTVSIVSLQKMPNNVHFPQNEENYIKFSLQKYSKFISSKISASSKKAVLGTYDGRMLYFCFRENHQGNIISQDPKVTRMQKKRLTREEVSTHVNCLDIGVNNYDAFVVNGGSQELNSYNLNKMMKQKTISTTSHLTGACTAVALHPKLEYIVYGTGSDWLQGLGQLQSIKKPKIFVQKLALSELKDWTSR